MEQYEYSAKSKFYATNKIFQENVSLIRGRVLEDAFWKTFNALSSDSMTFFPPSETSRKICDFLREDLFFFGERLKIRRKFAIFCKTENTCALCPWSRPFLFLTSDFFCVLGVESSTTSLLLINMSLKMEILIIFSSTRIKLI